MMTENFKNITEYSILDLFQNHKNDHVNRILLKHMVKNYKMKKYWYNFENKFTNF